MAGSVILQGRGVPDKECRSPFTPLHYPAVKDLLEARHRVINERAGAAKLGRCGAQEVGGAEIKGGRSTMQSTHRSNKARVDFGTT